MLCSSRKNPYPPHGRSLEIPRGRGVLKAKFLEAMYENKPEFPGGGGGGAKQKTFCGGSMDIFWNCTLSSKSDRKLAPRQSCHLLPLEGLTNIHIVHKKITMN